MDISRIKWIRGHATKMVNVIVINAAESSNNSCAANKYVVTECNVWRWQAQKNCPQNANIQRTSTLVLKVASSKRLTRECMRTQLEFGMKQSLHQSSNSAESTGSRHKADHTHHRLKAELALCNTTMHWMDYHCIAGQVLPNAYPQTSLRSFFRAMWFTSGNHIHPSPGSKGQCWTNTFHYTQEWR